MVPIDTHWICVHEWMDGYRRSLGYQYSSKCSTFFCVLRTEESHTSLKHIIQHSIKILLHFNPLSPHRMTIYVNIRSSFHPPLNLEQWLCATSGQTWSHPHLRVCLCTVMSVCEKDKSLVEKWEWVVRVRMMERRSPLKASFPRVLSGSAAVTAVWL